MREKSQRYTKFIHSSRWRKLRQTLIQANPICTLCDTAFTREVHHKTPPRSYMDDTTFEALFFDTDNLMPLCQACHRQLHEESGKQTTEYYADIAKRKLDAMLEKFG